MLATGTATVLAVHDRAAVGRPEAKDSDASDGQFAGLMAHWTQPPPAPKAPMTPKAPEKPNPGPKEAVHRRPSASTEPHETQTAAPDTPTSAGARSAFKPGAPSDQPDSPATKPESPSSKPESPTDQVEGPAKPTPPTAPSVPPTTVPTGSMDAAAEALLTASDAPKLPEVQRPIPPQSTTTTAAPPQGAPSTEAPTIPALQGLVPPSAPLPPVKAIAPSETALAKALPSTDAPPVDPAPSQAPLTTQAVLAEGSPKAKEKAPAKDPQAPTEASQAPPLPAAAPMAKKAGPALLASPEPQEVPVPELGKADLPTTTLDKVLEADPRDPGTSKFLPLAPSAEGLLADAAPALAPASLSLHADSNPMAAISALPRSQAQPAGATPTAPARATPTPPTAPVAQVEGGLRWMLKGGAQEAHLQLHPESLGQVTIHLRVEGGEVHARLWVTEPASVQAVQDGRPHLEASLKEQGLQLGSFDLQQGSRPFQESPSASSFPGGPALNAVPARQEPPPVPAASILNAHHVELYA